MPSSIYSRNKSSREKEGEGEREGLEEGKREGLEENVVTIVVL